MRATSLKLAIILVQANARARNYNVTFGRYHNSISNTFAPHKRYQVRLQKIRLTVSNRRSNKDDWVLLCGINDLDHGGWGESQPTWIIRPTQQGYGDTQYKHLATTIQIVSHQSESRMPDTLNQILIFYNFHTTIEFTSLLLWSCFLVGTVLLLVYCTNIN